MAVLLLLIRQPQCFDGKLYTGTQRVSFTTIGMKHSSQKHKAQCVFAVHLLGMGSVTDALHTKPSMRGIHFDIHFTERPAKCMPEYSWAQFVGFAYSMKSPESTVEIEISNVRRF